MAGSEVFDAADLNVWLRAAIRAQRRRGLPLTRERLAWIADCEPTHISNLSAGRRAVVSAMALPFALAAGLDMESSDHLRLRARLAEGKTEAALAAAVAASLAARQARIAQGLPIAPVLTAKASKADLALVSATADPAVCAPLVWLPAPHEVGGRDLHDAVLSRVPLLTYRLSVDERETRALAWALPAGRVPDIDAFIRGRLEAIASRCNPRATGPRVVVNVGAWMFQLSDHAVSDGVVQVDGGKDTCTPSQVAIKSPSGMESKVSKSANVLGIDVLCYDSFVDFLDEVLRRRKASRASLSAAGLAARLEISRSAVYSVIKGRRHFPADAIEGLCEYLNLSGDRAEFLRGLAELRADQAQPALHERMAQIRLRNGVVSPERDAFAVLTRWECLAVLELAALPEFRPDIAWIAATVQILPEEARYALADLIALGFLVPDGDGVPRPAQVLFRTPDTLRELQLHRAYWRASELARIAVKKAPRRTIGQAFSASVALDEIPGVFKAIVELFDDLIQKFTSIRETESPDRVYGVLLNASPAFVGPGYGRLRACLER